MLDVNNSVHSYRIITLLFASLLAGPALAQGGPKPAPTRVPAQAAAVRMSQSPDPTFDEGTIQRMAAAMLSYTALDAGLALSPRGVGAFMATILVGRLVGKISNRILITVGFIGLAYSSFLFGNINLSIGMSSIVWPTILSGIAISFIFVPLATSSMGTVAQDQIGNASGLFNLMRNLGGSIGIAGITSRTRRTSRARISA